MTLRLPIRLLLLTFIGLLMGCAQKPKPQPPPPVNVSVAVSQVATALCLEWKGSEPSWEDADTEATKDLIDLAIRIRQAACKDYIPK
jgi:hypothetical protein